MVHPVSYKRSAQSPARALGLAICQSKGWVGMTMWRIGRESRYLRSSAGSTPVPSARTASRARGSMPKALRMVGATWAVPTSAFTVLRSKARIGEQQNDIGVVMGEPAVLGLFCVAAGVRNADVRGHDDVRRARVYGWVVVVQRQARAIVELPKPDSGGRSIVLRGCSTAASVSDGFFSQSSETSSSVDPMPLPLGSIPKMEWRPATGWRSAWPGKCR